MIGPRRRPMPWRAALAATVAMALSTVAPAARAQAIGLPGQSRDTPLEINASNGIEWQQEARAYVARGNARAVQGDVAVYADTLIAYYRDAKGGGTEIWRMDARDNVRIVAPNQTAYGDKGIYDVDKGVLVLTGRTRLVTAQDRITSRDSLEYWEKRSLAVARGNAIAVRGDKRLRADVLTALFRRDKAGKSRMHRIEAFDNVLVSSPSEIARSRRGVYNVTTGIVMLSGGVKITRGNDQMNGETAEVNLNTGVSRMLSNGKGRVRGVFKPQSTRDRTQRGN